MKKEWEKEPNELPLQLNGFMCKIRRNSLGCLCGYVALPKKHPYYGKDYMEITGLDVHGGLTFSQGGDGIYFEKNYHWIGFDCGHSGDHCPIFDDLKIPQTALLPGIEATYKNIQYVKNELESLTKQLLPVNMAIKKLIGDE